MPATKRKAAKGKRLASLARKVGARKAGQVKGGDSSLSPSQQAQVRGNIASTYNKSHDAIIQKIK